MASVDSTRELHTQFAITCSALEALFRYCSDDDFASAAQPALDRFRDLLDIGDNLIPPESA